MSSIIRMAVTSASSTATVLMSTYMFPSKKNDAIFSLGSFYSTLVGSLYRVLSNLCDASSWWLWDLTVSATELRSCLIPVRFDGLRSSTVGLHDDCDIWQVSAAELRSYLTTIRTNPLRETVSRGFETYKIWARFSLLKRTPVYIMVGRIFQKEHIWSKNIYSLYSKYSIHELIRPSPHHGSSFTIRTKSIFEFHLI